MKSHRLACERSTLESRDGPAVRAAATLGAPSTAKAPATTKAARTALRSRVRPAERLAVCTPAHGTFTVSETLELGGSPRASAPGPR